MQFISKHLIFSLILVASISSLGSAQKDGPIIYDGCKYQKCEGLAEITSVRVINTAQASPLGYEEYEVLYNFLPMDKNKPTEAMANQPILLREGAYEFPLNKAYIEKYAVLVGTKVPMTFWYIKKGTCTPTWYTSAGLPNDLSVLGDQLTSLKTKELERRMQLGNQIAEQTKEAEIAANVSITKVAEPIKETKAAKKAKTQAPEVVKEAVTTTQVAAEDKTTTTTTETSNEDVPVNKDMFEKINAEPIAIKNDPLETTTEVATKTVTEVATSTEATQPNDSERPFSNTPTKPYEPVVSKPVITYNTATGPILYDGCKYQKYEGLAEITSIQMLQSAKNSALGYDEYEIRYAFAPIDAKVKQTPEMLDQTFTLRDGTFEYLANKEYISKYALLVGTKVPMTFWLMKKGTCTPSWCYSNGMPNDLSIFGDNLLELKNKELQRRMEAGNKIAEQTSESIQATMPKPTVTEKESLKPRTQPSVTTPKVNQEVELKPKENITFDDKYKEVDPTKNAKYNAASGDGGEVSTVQIEPSVEQAPATTEPTRNNTTPNTKPAVIQATIPVASPNTSSPQTPTTTTLPTPTSTKEAVRMARERREQALKKQLDSEIKQQKDEQQRLKAVASNLNDKTKSVQAATAPTITRPVATAPMNCKYTLEEEGTLKVIEVQKIAPTELKIIVKFTPNNPQAISSGYWFRNQVLTVNGLNPSNEFVRKNKLYNGVEIKATAAMGEGNCPPKFVSPSIQE